MKFKKEFLRVVSLALVVLVLIPGMPSYAATFKDVNSSHWAYSYIERMAKEKYINGYEDGTFKPRGTLTFLETIQLLSKLLNLSSSEISKSKQDYGKLVNELKIDTWAQEAVMKCLYAGVISETELRGVASKGLLERGTNKRVGRLDISVFMAKAMGLLDEANAKPFVTLTFKDLSKIDAKYHKLIYMLIETGVLSANGTGEGYFEPNSPLLREQMAKMLATAYDYLQKKPQTPTPTPTPTPTNDTEELSGVIAKLTKIGDFTYLTIKGKEDKAYILDSNTVIKLDGKTSNVNSLFEGQRIGMTVKKGSTAVLTLEAEILEVEISGTIKSLSPSLNKLVVEYVKSKVTNTIELTVDKNTEISLNGVEADLYDLTVGDEVNVLVENNLVIDLEAIAKSGEVEGIIVDLVVEGDRNPIYYITIENSKKVKTEYELDKDVDIYRDGRRADFKDLKIGDEAVLELKGGLIVEIDADMVEKEIEGYITGISTKLNVGTEITIRNRETDKDETYVLGRNAVIKVDKTTSSIINLNVGYYVEVVVGSNEIIEIYADSVGAESIVRGKITGVSTRRNEIDVQIMTTDLTDYGYGDEIVIRITDDTFISDGYRSLKLVDLERNDIIYVFGYYDGIGFTASEINLR